MLMAIIRQQIIELLAKQQLNARDLSRELHIMEKEVYSHLEHEQIIPRHRR